MHNETSIDARSGQQTVWTASKSPETRCRKGKYTRRNRSSILIVRSIISRRNAYFVRERSLSGLSPYGLPRFERLSIPLQRSAGLSKKALLLTGRRRRRCSRAGHSGPHRQRNTQAGFMSSPPMGPKDRQTFFFLFSVFPFFFRFFFPSLFSLRDVFGVRTDYPMGSRLRSSSRLRDNLLADTRAD